MGADKISHPYDGDGLILSIAFRGGRAHFRSRFVRTAEYVAEQREQRILFRGTFATQRPGGQAANALDVYVKNTSNTNVVAYGGRLLTLFEAGQPYRLDPATLETQARRDKRCPSRQPPAEPVVCLRAMDASCRGRCGASLTQCPPARPTAPARPALLPARPPTPADPCSA